jgi:site-specific DNA-methyltransferase (adenine-specific)
MPKKPVGNQFTSRVALPTFFGEPSLKGTLHKNEHSGDSFEPCPYYSHPHGRLWFGDSIRWLEQLEPESVDLVFADPPYSIGKAEWDEFESHDKYIEWSLSWIELVSKLLRPHGSLYICGYSEILADLRRPASRFFSRCKWLVWFYKNKANLGNDWGRSHESIIHFRKNRKFIFNTDDVRIPYGSHTLKYPQHPQAVSSQYGNGVKRSETWQPHPKGARTKDVLEIPVTSNGMAEKTPHPTQKPEELLRTIILASSNEGDVVLDPFVGSGTTLVCAEQLHRRWLGIDSSQEYCSWAAARLENIPQRSVGDWIEFDRSNRRRRESIR